MRILIIVIVFISVNCAPQIRQVIPTRTFTGKIGSRGVGFFKLTTPSMSIIAKEARLGINTKDGLLVNFTSDWNLDFSIRSAMVNDCGIMIADPNREYRFTGYFETVYNGNIRTTFFPRVFTKRKFLLRSDEFSYFGTLKRDRYGNFTQINIEKDKEYCMQELKRIFGDQFNENKVKPRLLVKYDD